MTRLLTQATLVLPLLCVGCIDLAEGRYACGSDDECPSGWSCNAGLCYSETTGGDGGMDAGMDSSFDTTDLDVPDGGSDGGSDAPDACTLTYAPVDLLFVVDDSGTMAAEQARLSEAIPNLLTDLAAAGIGNINAGVVSTFMPVGGDVTTCFPDIQRYGYDGVLTTERRFDTEGCAMSYPNYVRYRSDDPDSVTTLSDVLTCKVQLGTVGCGFEQPLEAGLKAISNNASLNFAVDPVEGHRDGANAPFRREGAILLVVFLTDELDCSVADTDLFDPENTTFNGDLMTRCAENPGALHQVQRYVDGLLGAAAADRLVFAALAGVPADLEEESSTLILGDTRMQLEIMTEPREGFDRVRPVCDGGGRLNSADPARRLVSVGGSLRERGVQAVFGSICAESYLPFFSRVTDAVVDAAESCE